MKLISSLLLLAALAHAQTARVSGRVVTPEGKPVSKATVRIQGTGGGRGAPQPKNYVEVTTSDGRFGVEDIAPGTYVATAQLNGYNTPNINNLPANRRPGAFTIAAGETRRDLEITLIPLGIVSGVVLDSDGEPVPRTQVTLLRYGYNNGRVMLQQNAGNATDDRGQFRLINVQAGRYFLRVMADNQPISYNTNDVRGLSAQLVSLPTYYPSSEDVRGATRIDVGSIPVENLQIRMRRGKTFAIRGRVDGVASPVANGPNPANGPRPNIQIMSKGSQNSVNSGTRFLDNGQFEVMGVPPGEYILTARMNENVSAQLINGVATVTAGVSEPRNRSARIELTVGSGDVENLVLRLESGFELTGRLTTDDGTDWKTFSQPPAGRGGVNPAVAGTSINGVANPQPARPVFNVNLIATNEGPIFNTPRGVVDEDGKFTAKDVTPGNYLLNVPNVGGGSYIKAVRYAGRDVTNQQLLLTSPAELEIVLSKKVGALTVTWPAKLADRKETDPNLIAIIWPATPNRIVQNGGVLTVQLQPQGAGSRIASIAPGEYYVAVFEAMPAQEMARIPEFLDRFKSVAKAITVREGPEAPVEPGVIPRDASQKAFDEFPN